MSRDASITLDFGDDTYVFRLAWAQLIQLQEACDAGPYVLLNRLMDGTWRIKDVSEPIRLGLIGGGMEPVKALKLVREYVEARPPMESLMFAQVIVSSALMGAPDEDRSKKNDAAEASELMTATTESSGSASSSETPRPRASRRKK